MNDFLLVDLSWYESTYKPLVEKYLSWTDDQITAAFGGMKFPETKPILSMDADSATIRIEGFMSMSGPSKFEQFLGISGTSYAEIQASIEQADKSLAAGKPIYLEMNTPGGMVAGAKETFDSIRAVEQSGREVVAMNMGVIASAGIWVGSAATRILATNPMNMAGSVGILITAKKPYDGEVTITNTDSPDKSPDVSTESGKAVVRSLMDDIYGVFIGDILSSRGDRVTESQIKEVKGRVLLAEKAISAGLMDGYFAQKTIVDITQNGNTIGKDGTAPHISAHEADGTEEKNMTPEEIQKMKAEMKAEIMSEIAAGSKPTPEEQLAAKHQEAIQAATPFLAGGSVYPDALKTMALDCINGKSNISELKAAAAAFDAAEEAKRSKEAADLAAGIGGTGSLPNTSSASGEIETEAQFQALIAPFTADKAR